MGRAICLTHSTDLNASLIGKHSHKHTQNNIQANVWALDDPVKLTHKLTITGTVLQTEQR